MNPPPQVRLTEEILVTAYANGYFPMPDEKGEEILWFRPDPRAIIPIDGFHVSRSLRRKIRNFPHDVKIDTRFESVMLACADRDETWINDEFLEAYKRLFDLGCAHSLEIYYQDDLVGGVYGVTIGSAFFAESMFHYMNDCSKLALYWLTEHLKKKSFLLLECQFMTEHLASLGAQGISDIDYIKRLKAAIKVPNSFL